MHGTREWDRGPQIWKRTVSKQNAIVTTHKAFPRHKFRGKGTVLQGFLSQSSARALKTKYCLSHANARETPLQFHNQKLPENTNPRKNAVSEKCEAYKILTPCLPSKQHTEKGHGES